MAYIQYVHDRSTLGYDSEWLCAEQYQHPREEVWLEELGDRRDR